MSDPFEKLRQTVLAELRKQRSTAAAPLDRAKFLGAFLQECLTNLGQSRADFARALDIEQELAAALLEGLLPESEIDDQFLADIAKAVHYESNLLRIMLGRQTHPVQDEDNV